MQISAANLLASQSQAVRTNAPAAPFEPIAFKQTPPSAVTRNDAAPKPAGSGYGAPTANASPSAGAPPNSGYQRPGSQIDIKI